MAQPTRTEHLFSGRVSASSITVLLTLSLGCASVEGPRIAAGWPVTMAERPLSHDDCVRLALESAANMAQWRSRLLAAAAVLRQARNYPNPLVSATWEDIGLGDGASAPPVQATFSLTYLLSDFLARPYRIAAAEAAQEEATASVGRDRCKLVAEVRHHYDELIASREREHLRGEILVIAARQENAAQHMASVGLIARIDARRAEVERMQAESDVAAA